MLIHSPHRISDFIWRMLLSMVISIWSTSVKSASYSVSNKSVLSPACMAPNIIKVCMMYWLWCDCERSCGSPSGSFLLRIFLKSACPLDGSQCSRAIWTWKSCDLERRLVIQSYLCKNALVYAIRRFMICKRVINCALVIIFALFQNIVLSFDVENFSYTRSGFRVENFAFNIAVN